MADIKYLDKTGLGTVKSILEGLFSPKGHNHVVTDITNFPSSMPASDVYDWAKAATKPSYSFSEINPGVATIGDGTNRLMFRTHESYRNGMYYSTPGNEALVFATKNSVTSWIFATTDPNSQAAWNGLTPSLQIKNQRVTINKLIPEGGNASYNLDVNGSANATTLYENGTRVALSGHNHDDRYYTEGEIDTKLAGKSNAGHSHSGIGDGALVHVCSLYAQATYNAYKIITNWNKASNYMPTINIRGYAYGSQKTIDCDIVMYHYNSEPCNYSITNKGSYDIKVYSAIENNVQVFYIEPGEYFGMFNVFVYGGIGTGNFTGWTMETASAVSGTELPKNAIATNVTGNAGSATKLETARTITIGNTGKSFNGQSNVSWTLSEIGAAASHEHPYLSLTGGTMEGNVSWKTGTGLASCFPAHIYRNTYDNDGNVYDHYYKSDTSSTNSFANLRVKSGTSFKLLRFGGDGTFTWDNKAVSLAGHGHTKSQITDFPSSLPANGGNADTVGGKGVSDFARFYLSPMDSGATAGSAKTWFTDTMPASSGAIVYNVPGSEKTIIAGKSSGAYGHMLQLNYDDTYLRILRYYAGSWKSTDWEKISAGYADTAGSAVDQTARNAAEAAQTTANGKWTYDASTIAGVKVNNAGYADSAGSSTISGDGTITIIPQYNNEINFGGTNASSTLYIGYRAAGSKPIPTGFVFGGSDGSASITASGFKKKSSSDSYVLLGGGGHKAISDFLTSLPSHNHDDRYYTESEIDTKLAGKSDTTHTHNYLPTTSSMIKGYSGSLSGYHGENGWHRIAEVNAGTYGYGSYLLYLCGTWNHSANTTAILAIDTTHTNARITQLSGYLGFVNKIRLVNISSNKYYIDIHINYSDNPSYSNDTPGAVYYYFLTNAGVKVTTSVTKITETVTASAEITLRDGGFANYATTAGSASASDVYSWAKASSKPSYNFGEIGAGVATIGDGANRIMFRTNASYKNGIYYSTPGNEALVFGTVNPVTSWIFATTDPTSQTAWTSLTPSMQIKNGKVAINKLIASGVEATYNLEVNGNINATNGFFDTSDERLKDFYDDIDVDFDKLKAIPKKYFSWKDDQNKEIHLGTSAQEIQKVYPEIVNESNTGELSVDYSKLSVVALAAVDKLYDKITRIEQALIDKGIL